MGLTIEIIEKKKELSKMVQDVADSINALTDESQKQKRLGVAEASNKLFKNFINTFFDDEELYRKNLDAERGSNNG